MKNIIESYYSSDGRFNRFKFWVYPIFMHIILILFVAILFTLARATEKFIGETLGGLIGAIAYFTLLCGSIYITFVTYIKRLHDLGKSGWLSLLILIPIVGRFYPFIICGFFKGTSGENKYGPDPLGGTKTSNGTPNEL